MWLSIYCHQLSLDALPSHHSRDEIGRAIVWQQRVFAVNERAQAAGVHVGMPASRVSAIAPDIHCQQREIWRESALIQAIACALQQYTPTILVFDEQSLSLEIGRSARLFGGLIALRQQIRSSLLRLGVHASTAYALRVHAGQLLARKAQYRRGHSFNALKMSRLSTCLDALPIELFSAAQTWLEFLHGLGCTTLGALRQLPRAGLIRRTSTTLVRELDQLYQGAETLPAYFSPPPELEVKYEPNYAITEHRLLLEWSLSLAEQLAGRMQAQQLACLQLLLTLRFEKQRAGEAPAVRIIPFDFTTPGWQAQHWIRLLREKLGQIQLDAPIASINLCATHLQARQTEVLPLLPQTSTQQTSQAPQHAQLLELLLTRLQFDEILQAQPQADVRDELANHWCSVLTTQTPKSATHRAGSRYSKGFPLHAPRPPWLLQQVRPLACQRHQPIYGSPLTLVSVGERIEYGWWDESVQTRDYFIASNRQAQHYWLYRERPRIPNNLGTNAAWFLCGVFG